MKGRPHKLQLSALAPSHRRLLIFQEGASIANLVFQFNVHHLFHRESLGRLLRLVAVILFLKSCEQITSLAKTRVSSMQVSVSMSHLSYNFGCSLTELCARLAHHETFSQTTAVVYKACMEMCEFPLYLWCVAHKWVRTI